MTTIFHHVVKLLLCWGVLTNFLASSSSLPILDEGNDGSEIHISNHRSLLGLFNNNETNMVSNKLKLLGLARCEWLVRCAAI